MTQFLLFSLLRSSITDSASTCQEAAPNFCYDVEASFSEVLPNVTSHECCAACAENLKCESFTHRPGEGCQMLRKIGHVNLSEGTFCTSGTKATYIEGTIPNSDRDAANPCRGVDGTECPYVCNSGYVAIGRHVCQNYETRSGVQVIQNQFFGGRCERLCDGSTECPNGEVPVRWNSSDADGPCLASRCAVPKLALGRLGRGAYSLWRLARSDITGIYSGTVDASVDATHQPLKAHTGSNGVGLMSECVAAEMGWQTVLEAAERVNLTLSALAGKLPGFTLARHKRGWLPTFFDRETGASDATRYSMVDTGLNMAGVLFSAKYFVAKNPQTAVARSIQKLSSELWQAVEFDNVLCNRDGRIDANGDGLSFTIDDHDVCGMLDVPQHDGCYGYSELHYTVWFAYNRACSDHPEGNCPNEALERMWQAWQCRRLLPSFQYKGHPLLSKWPAYIVQLPFYATHSFNADRKWNSLFASHWSADWAYFNSSKYFAGDGGRYGLAAGFTDRWCAAKGSSYEADELQRDVTTGGQGCRLYSPGSVAGYIPAAPDVIQTHLLELLATGESVYMLPDDSGFYVLLRKSMLESGWSQINEVSMVDFAPELLGLSTLWLKTSFFTKYTDHFSRGTQTS
eukprot:TRINITY_DN48413_c0_g1_i1.p1 TRINITY_DN48413_c0_g1~~TRINITY_DN48413_c0_g1_i1.p1  ORF type:complete len:640 (-),score=54.90 TRINITY_DN48413_c0_g1_i1:72-1952(-)